MTELAHTVPGVLTNHTDVICSTSIERIATGHNVALAKIEVLIHQLDDLSALTNNIMAKHFPGMLPAR